MWSLCVLCALLSPVQGQAPGGSDHTDVFFRPGSGMFSVSAGQAPGGSNHTDVFCRPGSDVLLPLGYNLTIDKDNKSLCDRFTWRYESFQISKSSRCKLTVNNNTQFSNHKILEDGNLTLSSVTRNNSGKYTVNVYKGGNEVFTHNYTLHILDPLLEPLLKVSCLPDGGSNISCSTNTSTDAWFSIMVNGHLLLNSTLSRTMGNVSEVHVPVASPGPWNITCSVRNQVSENETMKTGEKCPVPPSVPVLEALCLHDGGREISCSVENGSDLVFSLSVNGDLEKDRKEEKRVNVTLSSAGPWTVNCSVRNDLGEKNNVTTFPACPVPPSVPALEVLCLQDGRSEVSCSVEKGTDLVFSLSANGKSLKNVTREEKRVNVTLSSPGPWVVHCSVRNNHGEKNGTKTFRACSVPVSVPIINVSCHHDGSARGVCSVEDGTNVSYSWTVNDKTIAWNPDTNLTINASEFTSGAINISCSAENSISKEQSNVTNIYCGGSCWTCLQKSIMGGMVALILITSPLFIASFYIGHNGKEDGS